MKWIRHQLTPESSGLHKDIKWMDRAALGFLPLAVILRIPWMFQSLWYDEISVTPYYLKNIFHLLDAWTYDTNMPVHYTLMFFWNKLFIDIEFFLRLPSLLFGLASLPLAYKVTKQFFDCKIALLTCFLLTISPVHIWYSTEARPYAGMMFFILLALLAFQQLNESEPGSRKNQAAWLGIYFLTLLLATFSHFYMVIPLMIFSLMSLFQKNRMRASILCLNGIILLLLIGFIWFKYKFAGYLPTGGQYLRQFTSSEAWLLFFNWFPMGNTIWPIEPHEFSWRYLLNHPDILCCQLFFFSLFLKGIIAVLRRSDNHKKFWSFAVLCFLFAIPVFLFIMNALGFRNTYIERSAYVGLPFFLMVISTGAVSESKTYLSRILVSGLVIITCLSTFGLFKNTNACTVGPCKPDWRSAARYLTKDVGASKEKAAVISKLSPRTLTYYDSSFADHIRLKRLQQHMPKMAQNAKRIFGVESPVFQAFRKEIVEIDKQLEIVHKDKIAVFDFSEIRRKENLPYQVFYVLDNPYTDRNPRGLKWLQRHADCHLIEKKSFHALDIYKLERLQ